MTCLALEFGGRRRRYAKLGAQRFAELRRHMFEELWSLKPDTRHPRRAIGVKHEFVVSQPYCDQMRFHGAGQSPL